MIVIDASALLEALAPDPMNVPLVERLLEAGTMYAPHLVDVEVLSGLRRLVAEGAVNEQAASVVKESLADLPIRRYPHTDLVARVWELRHNLSAYDASYVALSEALDLPLVTSDGRLARAPGHRATIELFEHRD